MALFQQFGSVTMHVGSGLFHCTAVNLKLHSITVEILVVGQIIVFDRFADGGRPRLA